MLVHGGKWDDNETSHLPLIAALALYYKRPIYEIIEYLKYIRKKHGDKAVQLELDFAISCRNEIADLYNKKSD